MERQYVSDEEPTPSEDATPDTEPRARRDDSTGPLQADDELRSRRADDGPREGGKDDEARQEFLAGLRATAPVLLGLIPFGLVAGATAVGAGLSVLQAAAMSVVVFAGASQLAMIDLLGRDGTLAVVVATALVVNARMVMYSASLAPYVLDDRPRWRALMAYVLTDQGFALSVTHYDEAADADEPKASAEPADGEPAGSDPTGRETVSEVGGRRWFYLGTAAPLWIGWQVCTVVGAVAGAQVPAWLPLRFAVPLTFLALLVPAIEDAPRVSAAVVGGAVATLGVSLPFNLGLLAGAVAGVAVGTVVAVRSNREVSVG